MTNGYGHLTTDTARSLGEAKPPVSGYDGVFSQLVGEQREAAVLIQRLSAVNPEEEREDLWPEVRAALMTHEQAKMQEVYSVIQGYPSLQPFVNEYQQLSQQLDTLVGELDMLPFNVDAWKLSFQRFAATIEVHMAKEETVVFPRAQQMMGAARAAELTVPYLSTKRALLTAT